MSNRSYDGEPLDLTYQHISERSNGQTVGGTTDDDKGEVKTDFWPSEVPPREELKDDYVAVIEAAADPTKEWESVTEISEVVVPHRSRHYAKNVLRKHWPSRNEQLKTDRTTVSNLRDRPDPAKEKKAYELSKLTAEQVSEIRRKLLNGESSNEVAESYPVTRRTLTKYASGDRAVDPDDPPAVEFSYDDGWHIPDETHDAEQTTLDEETDADDETVEDLTSINGVGSYRAEWLQQAGFETVEDVATASIDELCDVKRFGEAYAKEVKKNARNGASEWSFFDSDTGSEEAEDAKETEDDAPQETATQPSPSRPPRNVAAGADGDPNRSRLKTALAALAAFVLGWVIGR